MAIFNFIRGGFQQSTWVYGPLRLQIFGDTTLSDGSRGKRGESAKRLAEAYKSPSDVSPDEDKESAERIVELCHQAVKIDHHGLLYR